MDSGERGMNPFAKNTISSRKGYWPSQEWNQEPPVLKHCAVPTELWGLNILTINNPETDLKDAGNQYCRNDWFLFMPPHQ